MIKAETITPYKVKGSIGHWRRMSGTSELVLELIERGLSEEEIADELYKALGRDASGTLGLMLRAQEDSVEGYESFYELVHGNRPPKHVIDEFIRPVYESKEEERGALIFAFRGSWKTSSITVTFTAFRMGQNPERANMVIQVNDRAAQDSTGAVADIIENNPGWKLVFPSVVPDKERGWGAEGYEVRDTRYSSDEWSKKNSARRDPSLVGYGYKSGSIIGRHPDGVLIIDDIHDEDNTVSDKELTHVINKVTGTIFPTVVQDGEKMVSWNVWVGTPWNEEDAYHLVKNTGEFQYTSTPVMRLSSEGVGEYFSVDELGELNGWYELTWPENFGRAAVIREYKKSGKREFARMYLLSLVHASETGVKYFSYPSHMIDLNWPSAGGCDYASILLEVQRDSKNRSYFAHAYLFKTPQNRLVVYDGVVERCTQAEAEAHLWKPQNMFSGWKRTRFESDGKGEEALHTFMRNPGLRLMPDQTHGVNKNVRTEKGLIPYFENGAIMISDASTPFLEHLRKELAKFGTGWFQDAIDSLFWAAKEFPECLVVPELDELGRRVEKKRTPNPYKALYKRKHGSQVYSR